MFAICVEASHKRGMGHLFRALNFINLLQEKKESYILLINDDEASTKILAAQGIMYKIVDYADITSGWEKQIIRQFEITVWINDKFESSKMLCAHVKESGIVLAVIDDRGAGANLANIHFAGMLFGKNQSNISGEQVFKGLAYNILNPEIANYRRCRKNIRKIVVTLGGSDTYGVTVQAVHLLKKYGYTADIITGANFRHKKELMQEISDGYHIFDTVPSLIRTFSDYDLAITGGGVTCLEANAAGLPCIIIANEEHEIDTGKFLEQAGGAVFAGYYKNIDDCKFDLEHLNIADMSIKAMETVPLNGSINVYEQLKKYEKTFIAK